MFNNNVMRFGGIYSGMDTENMVRQLMRAESFRLDRLKQRRTMTEWRQTAYRNAANVLRDFQSKRLSVTAANNIRMPSSFNSIVASKITTGDAPATGITVNAGNATKTGTFDLQVVQTASKDIYMGNSFDRAIQGKDGIHVAGLFGGGENFTINAAGSSFKDFVERIGNTTNGGFAINLASDPPINIALTPHMTQLDALITADNNEDIIAFMNNTVLTGTGVNFNMSGNNFSFTSVTNPTTTPISLTVNEIPTNYNFNVSLNGGASVTIGFTTAEIQGFANGQAMADAINTQLLAAFGPGLENYNKVFMVFNADDSFSLVAETGHTASISAGPHGGHMLRHMGFDESSSSTVFDTSALASTIFGADTHFTINGVNFTVGTNDTIQDIITEVNNSSAGVTLSFDRLRSAFRLESNEIGKQGEIKSASDVFISAFLGAGSALDLDTLKNGVPPLVAGDPNDPATNNGGRISTANDAIIIYDGVRTSRSNNHFVIDGITITLSDSLNIIENVTPPTTFTIELTRDTEPVMNMIKQFVDEYNALMQFLNDQTRTARPRGSSYSFYDPLTDDQKANMKDREIEQWEEKAKTGLLFRDDILSGIQSQMRSLIYADVTCPTTGNKIALHQIGITTSSASGHIGLLQIDENKLRTALETNADEVQRLFTQSSAAGSTRAQRISGRTGGLGERLNDIVENAIGNNGSIYNKAGFTGTASVMNNDLYRELKDQDRRIDLMLANLARKEQSYYAMFARLESALAKSDAQMQSMLSAMGGF